MAKHKYPTNWWFDMEVKGKNYHITIDMFSDQDEYDDNFNYCVEIFPQDQSKESFEKAEFWGTYTSSKGVCMKSYPSEWTDEDKGEFIAEVHTIDEHIQEVCEYCNEDITEAVNYETEDGRLLCEKCYIQYLAKRKE